MRNSQEELNRIQESRVNNNDEGAAHFCSLKRKQ